MKLKVASMEATSASVRPFSMGISDDFKWLIKILAYAAKEKHTRCLLKVPLEFLAIGEKIENRGNEYGDEDVKL